MSAKPSKKPSSKSAKSSKKPSSKSQVKKDSKVAKGSSKSVANKRMAAEIPPKTKKGAVKKGKK
jgi:hypothetical protein